MSSTRAATVAATAVLAGAVLTGSAGAAVSTIGGSAYRGGEECRAGDVTARYHPTDAGMSHRYGRIVVVNTSDRTCVIQGYGGLSYVGGGDGTQVGAAATRTPGQSPRTVLAPGDRVRSEVEATDTEPYSRGTCRPAHVDGFRLYLPDDTHALFLASPTTGCRNTSVHLLAHQPFH